MKRMEREVSLGLSPERKRWLTRTDDSLGLPSVTQKKRERQESSASPQWDGGAWRKKGKGKEKSKEKHKRNSERASDTPNLDGTGSRSRRG